MSQRFLRLPDVLKQTGLSRSSIYALMKKQAFPQSHSISERCVAWLETNIENWVKEKTDTAQGVNHGSPL